MKERNIRIIVGGRFDYIKYAYSNLAENGAIIFFDNESYLRKISLKERLKRAIINRISQKSDLAYVKRNYIEYFPIDKLHKSDHILFILYEMNLMSTDFKSIKIIKENFPKAKFVLFFSNTIGTVRKEITREILGNRQLYDLIYSFNAKDAVGYGFETFMGGVFPCSSIDCIGNKDYISDIFFIGKDKGRLSHLISFVNLLNERLIKCKFLIFTDELTYKSIVPSKLPMGIILSKDYIPYSEVIKYAANSKCIFEYSVSETPTLRYSEAIAFGKKLLTNAGNLTAHPLYTPEQFFVYDDDTSINKIFDFIESPLRDKYKVPPRSISANNFINELIDKLF